MSKTPLKSNSVKLTEALTIIDEDLGFYERIVCSIGKNGNIGILDKGNKRVVVYNPKGEKQFEFGKEGNGPGEFNGFEWRLDMLEDYIVIPKWDKLIVFDVKGTFLFEIKEMIEAGKVAQKDKNIQISWAFGEDGNEPEFLSKTFGSKGEPVSQLKNVKFKEKDESEEAHFDEEKWIKNDYTKPHNKQKFLNFYVQYYKGDYKLEVLNKNNEPLFFVSRPFDRLELTEDVYKFTTGNKKEEAEINARINAQFRKLNGSFKSDIQRILGSKNGFLFLSTASDKKTTLSIDVLNSNFQLYDTIELQTDEIKYVNIQEGKLVLRLYSEEEGPYAKIFDINL